MSKPTTADSGDHWRRLAAELGLEIEPAPPAHTRSDSLPEPTIGRDKKNTPDEHAPTEPEGIWTADQHSLEELGNDEPVAPIEITTAELESQGARSNELAEPAEETGEGEKPRRRRRRSRRKKGDEAPTERAAAAPDVSAAEEHDDETPAEVVRNWNIPSWNDLVASLYRPDR